MSEVAIQRDQPLWPRLQSQSKEQPRPLGHDIFHYRQRSFLRPLKIPVSSPRKSTSGPGSQRKTISHQHHLNLLLSRARRALADLAIPSVLTIKSRRPYDSGKGFGSTANAKPIGWMFSGSNNANYGRLEGGRGPGLG